MLAAVLAKIGIEEGFKLSRAALVWLVVAGLFACGAVAFWRGVAAIERMELAAFSRGRSEANAYWQGEIAKSNAQAEKARAEQAIAAAKASAEADAKITDLTKSLTEWEARNAAKPDHACLDAGDVDDLNRLRRPGAARANGANRAR